MVTSDAHKAYQEGEQRIGVRCFTELSSSTVSDSEAAQILSRALRKFDQAIASEFRRVIEDRQE
jgi:hypothetical protein